MIGVPTNLTGCRFEQVWNPRKNVFEVHARAGLIGRSVADVRHIGDAEFVVRSLNGQVAGTLSLIEMYPASIALNAWTAGRQNIMMLGTGFEGGATVTVAGLSLTFLSKATAWFTNDILWSTWDFGDLVAGTYDAVYSAPSGQTATLVNALVVTAAI